MREILKILFLLSTMFILNIMGVTFLPTIASSSVRTTFALALVLMSTTGIFLVLSYQIEGIRNTCKELKKQSRH